MLKKILGLIFGKDDSSELSGTKQSRQLLLPRYDQRINYNPEIDNGNASLEKLEAYNKKGDKQFEQIKKADGYIEDGKAEQGLKIYHKILLEEGLYLNSQSIVMGYLNHLYKLERYDEAWGGLNQYVIKYPSLEKKYQDFRVKILKKEKRYKDALYHQVLAILFDNIHYQIEPQDSYEKKYMMLLKKLKKEDKAQEIQDLINRYSDMRRYEQREIRDDVSAIILSNGE